MLIPHFVILWPFPTAGGGTECFILESEAGDVLYLDLLSLWVIKLSPGKGWSGRPGQGRSRGENVEICHWGRRLSHLQTPGTGQHWGSETSCNPFSVISRDNHAETRVKSTSSSISSLDGRIVNVPGDKLQSTPDTQHSPDHWGYIGQVSLIICFLSLLRHLTKIKWWYGSKQQTTLL